jgi:hypothetical protein
MTSPGPFDDLPVLGKLPPREAIAKLRELGDAATADAIEQALEDHPTRAATFGPGKKWWWPFEDKPWQHTAHAFGYLAPAPPGAAALPILHAGNIAPDASLKNARVKITLDRLRVAAYPGGGTHRVLFDFYAENQLPGQVEQLHFNATYRAREGEQVAVISYPLFIGLNVGTEGLSFKCFTVNVKNDADEAFLGFLESDVFKAGLRLASAAQPAIAPLSGMAVGLTRAIAARSHNVPVQEFYMGLDFGSVPTGARLAEGAYLAVQIPEKLLTVWTWDDWIYNPSNGQIVSRADPTKLIPYNYVAFGVRRYEGT